MGDVFAYFRKDLASQVEELLALGERAERDSVRRLGTSFGEHLWGFGAPMDPAVPSVAGEKAGRLLGIMRGIFDYTVVDCPASYADHVLAALDLLAFAPDSLMLTAPWNSYRRTISLSSLAFSRSYASMALPDDLCGANQA